MQEFNLCPRCGGVKSLRQPTITGMVRTTAFKMCACKTAPVTKHDGRLNEDGSHNVYPNNFGGIAIHANNGIVWMNAREALSLLAWLKQEEVELQRLAKEQERG